MMTVERAKREVAPRVILEARDMAGGSLPGVGVVSYVPRLTDGVDFTGEQ